MPVAVDRLVKPLFGVLDFEEEVLLIIFLAKQSKSFVIPPSFPLITRHSCQITMHAIFAKLLCMLL